MKLRRWWYKLTHWEQWHYNVKYVLLSPAWLWYSLRAGTFYFFSPANPGLTFGGFEGGPKKEIYERLPQEFYPKSIYIEPSFSLNEVEQRMKDAGLQYPIAVKPNIGMMGLMFRKIDNRGELSIYHQTMTVTYILQALIYYPVEISVFYYRMPDQQKGTITGFVRKEALEVAGDGVSTLENLMQGLIGRPGFKIDEWEIKHKNRLQEIIPAGGIFRLAWVANLSRGARLVNIEDQKDDQLLQLFDSISHTARFYYGRYDIKCTSIEELKKGINFSIVEFNGTGAEPHHVYGNGNNFFQAARIIIHHWQVLFSIARYHYKQGSKYKTTKEGIEFTRQANRHFNHLRELDKKMPVFH